MFKEELGSHSSESLFHVVPAVLSLCLYLSISTRWPNREERHLAAIDCSELGHPNQVEVVSKKVFVGCGRH